jgi:hypothetical protein
VAGEVIWYRFRATLRRRLGAYLALTVFLGLIGGLAFVAARSTESSQAFARCHLFPSWAQLPETINVNVWLALEANPVPALSVTW